MALPAEFGEAQAVELLPNILKMDENDKRSTNRWGAPQNLARNILVANITLTYLSHPNVFTGPAAEAVRIFDLLYAEACLQEKKEAFRITFPLYVSEHRNHGKVHPPLPEIPMILDQFWDACMDKYRIVFKIKRDLTQKKTPVKDGQPRKLKPLVQKIIEMERRRKREEAKAAAAAAAQRAADAQSPLVALTKSTIDTVKGSLDSKRATTWGVFNKMLHPGRKPRKQGKSNGHDGSVDEEKFVGDGVLGTQILGSMGLMAPESGPSLIDTTEEQETSIHHSTTNIYDDYLCLAEHIEYVEGQPRVSEDSFVRKMDELHKVQQNEDDGPHEEFQRLKLIRDGSMEVSVSVDEAQDEVLN